MTHMIRLRERLAIARTARIEIETDLKTLDSLTYGQAMTQRETELKTRLNREYCSAVRAETELVLALSRSVTVDFRLFLVTRVPSAGVKSG